MQESSQGMLLRNRKRYFCLKVEVGGALLKKKALVRVFDDRDSTGYNS